MKFDKFVPDVVVTSTKFSMFSWCDLLEMVI